MNANISPEEKLLRLIKGQKKQDNLAGGQGSGIIPDANTTVKQSTFSFGFRFLSLPYFKKILIAIFVASCVYLILVFIYPMIGLNRIKLTSLAKGSISDSTIDSRIEVRPFESYLEIVNNRQIFSSSLERENKNVAPVVSADLLKDINLIGIITGDNPQAVIEDKKTQKTYYVGKGQTIAEFQVEDILEGKIILNYNDQKFELYL